MHVGLCAPAEVIKRAPAQLCFEESLNLLFKVRSNKAFMSECRPSPNARGVVRMSAFRGRRRHPKLERPCPPVDPKATAAIPYRTVPEHRPRASFAPSA